MPKRPSKTRDEEQQWAQILEQDRKKAHPPKNAGSALVLAAPMPNGDSGTWSKQLEHDRQTKARLTGGLNLPGPGAVAAEDEDEADDEEAQQEYAEEEDEEEEETEEQEEEGEGDEEGEEGDDEKSQLSEAKQLLSQAAEQASSTLLTQLLEFHWGLFVSIEGTLVAIFITGPALNGWFVGAHILQIQGLAKFKPWDLLMLLGYDLICAAILTVFIVLIVILVVLVMCIAGSDSCPVGDLVNIARALGIV